MNELQIKRSTNNFDGNYIYMSNYDSFKLVFVDNLLGRRPGEKNMYIEYIPFWSVINSE